MSSNFVTIPIELYERLLRKLDISEEGIEQPIGPTDSQPVTQRGHGPLSEGIAFQQTKGRSPRYEQNRQYYLAHKDKKKEYYQQNRERILARAKQRYLELKGNATDLVAFRVQSSPPA